eukprot:Sro203_g085550.2  (1643) ;mRNA; f:11193-16121
MLLFGTDPASDYNEHSTLHLILEGKDMVDVGGWFGSTDPFFTLLASTATSTGSVLFQAVHTSEEVASNLNPRWKKAEVSLKALCDLDINKPIRIQCDDWEPSDRHNPMGYFDTSVADLLKVSGDASKTAPLRDKGEEYGKLIIRLARIKTPRDDLSKRSSHSRRTMRMSSASGASSSRGRESQLTNAGRSSSSRKSSAAPSVLLEYPPDFGGCNEKDVFHLTLEGRDLVHVGGWFDTTNPYYQLTIPDTNPNDGKLIWQSVYRSEHIEDSLSPFWKEAPVTLMLLCEGDLFKSFRVFVYSRVEGGDPIPMGFFDTTVRELITASRSSDKEFVLQDENGEKFGALVARYAQVPEDYSSGSDGSFAVDLEGEDDSEGGSFAETTTTKEERDEAKADNGTTNGEPSLEQPSNEQENKREQSKERVSSTSNDQDHTKPIVDASSTVDETQKQEMDECSASTRQGRSVQAGAHLPELPTPRESLASYARSVKGLRKSMAVMSRTSPEKSRRTRDSSSSARPDPYDLRRSSSSRSMTSSRARIDPYDLRRSSSSRSMADERSSRRSSSSQRSRERSPEKRSRSSHVRSSEGSHRSTRSHSMHGSSREEKSRSKHRDERDDPMASSSRSHNKTRSNDVSRSEGRSSFKDVSKKVHDNKPNASRQQRSEHEASPAIQRERESVASKRPTESQEPSSKTLQQHDVNSDSEGSGKQSSEEKNSAERVDASDYKRGEGSRHEDTNKVPIIESDSQAPVKDHVEDDAVTSFAGELGKLVGWGFVTDRQAGNDASESGNEAAVGRHADQTVKGESHDDDGGGINLAGELGKLVGWGIVGESIVEAQTSASHDARLRDGHPLESFFGAGTTDSEATTMRSTSGNSNSDVLGVGDHEDSLVDNRERSNSTRGEDAAFSNRSMLAEEAREKLVATKQGQFGKAKNASAKDTAVDLGFMLTQAPAPSEKVSSESYNADSKMQEIACAQVFKQPACEKRIVTLEPNKYLAEVGRAPKKDHQSSNAVQDAGYVNFSKQAAYEKPEKPSVDLKLNKPLAEVAKTPEKDQQSSKAVQDTSNVDFAKQAAYEKPEKPIVTLKLNKPSAEEQKAPEEDQPSSKAVQDTDNVDVPKQAAYEIPQKPIMTLKPNKPLAGAEKPPEKGQQSSKADLITRRLAEIGRSKSQSQHEHADADKLGSSPLATYNADGRIPATGNLSSAIVKTEKKEVQDELKQDGEGRALDGSGSINSDSKRHRSHLTVEDDFSTGEKSYESSHGFYNDDDDDSLDEELELLQSFNGSGLTQEEDVSQRENLVDVSKMHHSRLDSSGVASTLQHSFLQETRDWDVDPAKGTGSMRNWAMTSLDIAGQSKDDTSSPPLDHCSDRLIEGEKSIVGQKKLTLDGAPLLGRSVLLNDEDLSNKQFDQQDSALVHDSSSNHRSRNHEDSATAGLEVEETTEDHGPIEHDGEDSTSHSGEACALPVPTKTGDPTGLPKSGQGGYGLPPDSTDLTDHPIQGGSQRLSNAQLEQCGHHDASSLSSCSSSSGSEYGEESPTDLPDETSQAKEEISRANHDACEEPAAKALLSGSPSGQAPRTLLSVDISDAVGVSGQSISQEKRAESEWNINQLDQSPHDDAGVSDVQVDNEIVEGTTAHRIETSPSPPGHV